MLIEKKTMELLELEDLTLFMDHQNDARQTMERAALYPQEMLRSYKSQWWGEKEETKDSWQCISDICKTCGGDIKIDNAESTRVCTSCGRVAEEGIAVSMDITTIRDAHLSGSSVVKKHIYERRVHFREYVQRLQGVCNPEIDEKTLGTIRERLGYYKTLTPSDVLYQLRLLKLSKLRGAECMLCWKYDNSRTYKPVFLDFDHHTSYFKLFVQIEGVFEKVKEVFKGRTNFFSYPCLFYNMSVYLGHTQYVRDVRLLKDSKLLEQQNKMFSCAMELINKK